MPPFINRKRRESSSILRSMAWLRFLAPSSSPLPPIHILAACYTGLVSWLTSDEMTMLLSTLCCGNLDEPLAAGAQRPGRAQTMSKQAVEYNARIRSEVLLKLWPSVRDV